MREREGVIHFDLDFRVSQCLNWDDIDELTGWRSVLHRLQLIGQNPLRYGGLGFGNISVRHSAHPLHFIITGSQTGAPQILLPSAYALVLACDPYTNTISAIGETPPSSESLTHGQVYQLLDSVQCVAHVHSPDIWNAAVDLCLPTTPREVPYGTPEMAFAVAELLSGWQDGVFPELPVFVMGGHEDGVVSYGRTVEESCVALIRLLALAGKTN